MLSALLLMLVVGPMETEAIPAVDIVGKYVFGAKLAYVNRVTQ